MINQIDEKDEQQQKLQGYLTQKGDRQQIEVILRQPDTQRVVEEEASEITLQEIFMILWKKLWLIVLCAVIGGGAAYMLTDQTAYVSYQSYITMYISGSSDKTQGVTSGDMSFAKSLIPTYMEILTSNTVLEQVVEQSGLDYSKEYIRSMLSTASVEDTGIFKVVVRLDNEEDATIIANTVADVASREIRRIIGAGVVEVIDYADTRAVVTKANVLLNTIIGVMLGMVLAVLTALVLAMLDTRIKTKESLEKTFGFPVLGTIQGYQISAKKLKKLKAKQVKRQRKNKSNTVHVEEKVVLESTEI